MAQKPANEQRLPQEQSAAIADLAGTLTGTVDGTLTDITFNATWSQGQADEINENFEEVQTKINAILAHLRTHGTLAS
jgi:hypothetical protein